MTTTTELPFTSLLGEPNATVSDILYEFITNGMDANPPATMPAITVMNKTIEISDTGSGLEAKHMLKVGRTSPRDPNKHGGHGIGLKDAIACCIRKRISLRIVSLNNSHSFEAFGDEYGINLISSPCGASVGTKIILSGVPNAHNEVEEIKEKFLGYSGLKKLKSNSPEVEVYECPPHSSGALYMMGVRKEGHGYLNRVYNFVKPTNKQKESISRNHTIMRKKFGQLFRDAIHEANRDETFEDPSRTINAVSHNASTNQFSRTAPAPPTTTNTRNITFGSTSSISSPILTKRSLTVDESVLDEIKNHCMTQDYHVWTCTTHERDRITKVTGEMLNLLRSIEGISVAETATQGSLAKNTFVPILSSRSMDTRRIALTSAIV